MFVRQADEEPLEGMTAMGTANTRQGITELRDEAFRLSNALSRDAALAAAPATAIQVATQMQSVAYLLGQIERGLDALDAKGGLKAA
jgi:hypothetical protein